MSDGMSDALRESEELREEEKVSSERERQDERFRPGNADVLERLTYRIRQYIRARGTALYPEGVYGKTYEKDGPELKAALAYMNDELVVKLRHAADQLEQGL